MEHPLQPVLNLFQERCVRQYFAVRLCPAAKIPVADAAGIFF
jgi:hypothetical protein